MRTDTRGPRRGAGERRVNDELFTRDSSVMHAGRFSRDVESIEEEARDAPALGRPKGRARSTEPGVGRARRDGANAGDGPTRVERPVRRLPSITHPSSARDPPEKALFGMGPRVPPVPHTRVCANRPPVPPTRAPSAPTRRANARRRHPHLLPARSRASLARSTSARGRRIGRPHVPRANAPASAPSRTRGVVLLETNLRAVRARTAETPPRARDGVVVVVVVQRRRSPRPRAARAPSSGARWRRGVRARRPALLLASSRPRALRSASEVPGDDEPRAGSPRGPIPGTRGEPPRPPPRPSPRGRVRRLADARRRDARRGARLPLILRRRARRPSSPRSALPR